MLTKQAFEKLETKNGTVVGSVLSSSFEVRKDDPKAWISIVECGSATGHRLMPLIVFAGKTLKTRGFSKDFPNWKFSCSSTGWANFQVLKEWFDKVFLPETKPEDPSLWRLLILDQHKTYVDSDFKLKAWKSKFWLSWLPSHPSHITQPLNIGVYKPLKVFYQQQTQDLTSYESTTPEQKRLFVKIYKDGSDKAFIVDNLKSGFRDSGFCPIVSDLAIKNWQADHHSPLLNSNSTSPEFQVNYEIETSISQNSRDVYRYADALTTSLDYNDRSFREFVKACGRAIDEKKVETAILKQKIAASQAALEAEEMFLGIDLDSDEIFDIAQEIDPDCEVLTERSQDKDSTAKKTNGKRKMSTIIENDTIAKRLHRDLN